jgi:hypothetical protein
MVFLQVGGQNQGAHGPLLPHPEMRQPESRFSFIRTVTVGPGISPDLLTSGLCRQKPERSRAAAMTIADTAGGEFHPAPRTQPAMTPADRF